MSTIDPAIVQLRRRRRPPSSAVAAVLLVARFAGGFGLGLGWGGMSLTSFDEADLLWQYPVGIVAGMILTIGGEIAWMFVVMKSANLGLGHGWAASLLGGGIGLWTVASRFGGPGPAVLIAAVLIALGTASLVLGVIAAASRRRQVRREEELIRTGTVTTATVSDQGYDFFHTSSKILTTVTFAFTDRFGQQRWVQRLCLIQQSDPLVNGQATRLWYDPDDPGNDRAIVVEAAHQRPLRAAAR